MGAGKTLDGMAVAICNGMYDKCKVYCLENEGDSHPVYNFYQEEKARLSGIGCKLLEMIDKDGVGREARNKLFYTWEQLAVVQEVIFEAVDVPTMRQWVRENRDD